MDAGGVFRGVAHWRKDSCIGDTLITSFQNILPSYEILEFHMEEKKIYLLKKKTGAAFKGKGESHYKSVIKIITAQFNRENINNTLLGFIENACTLIDLYLYFYLHLRRIILFRYKQAEKVKGLSRFQLPGTRCCSAGAGQSVTWRIKQPVSHPEEHRHTDTQMCRTLPALLESRCYKKLSRKPSLLQLSLLGILFKRKTRGWGKEGEWAVGNYCLLSTEFQFGMVKKVWIWIVVMVAQQYECT